MANARQKLAVKYMAQGMTEEKALIKAGYKPSYARSGLIKIKTGFKELMEKNLPDNMLLKVHREGLMATTKKPHLIDRDDKGRPIYDYIPEEDYSVRHKYLDSAYKIKGKYPKEGPSVAVQINVNEDREKYA